MTHAFSSYNMASMSSVVTPGRSTLAGSALLMACACALSSQAAKAVALTGVGVGSVMIHPLLIGLGAGLVLYGLAKMGARFAALAALAFTVLAVAVFLTPPRVMTSGALPWSAIQVAGGGLYLLAAALLGVSLWWAFPTPRPDASALAVGGAAISTGCGCCMFTGATTGLVGTAGIDPGFASPSTIVFWIGLAAVAIGLAWLGGVRAAIWVPVAAVVVRFGPSLLRTTGDWDILGVSVRVFAGYAVTLVGVGILLYGFAVAWAEAWERDWGPATTPRAEPAWQALSS